MVDQRIRSRIHSYALLLLTLTSSACRTGVVGPFQASADWRVLAFRDTYHHLDALLADHRGVVNLGPGWAVLSPAGDRALLFERPDWFHIEPLLAQGARLTVYDVASRAGMATRLPASCVGVSARDAPDAWFERDCVIIGPLEGGYWAFDGEEWSTVTEPTGRGISVTGPMHAEDRSVLRQLPPRNGIARRTVWTHPDGHEIELLRQNDAAVWMLAGMISLPGTMEWAVYWWRFADALQPRTDSKFGPLDEE